jgi:hypothetical protein
MLWPLRNPELLLGQEVSKSHDEEHSKSVHDWAGYINIMQDNA